MCIFFSIFMYSTLYVCVGLDRCLCGSDICMCLHRERERECVTTYITQKRDICMLHCTSTVVQHTIHNSLWYELLSAELAHTRTWATCAAVTAASRDWLTAEEVVNSLPCSRGVGWGEGGGGEKAPQKLIRTDEEHLRFRIFTVRKFSPLPPSRTCRHVVYVGGRAEAAEEPPGGKSLAPGRRSDIGGVGGDVVRRGSAFTLQAFWRIIVCRDAPCSPLFVHFNATF